MNKKIIGSTLILICVLIGGGFMFMIGGWPVVIVGALTATAVISGVFGAVMLAES